jgi:hypothetical protein
MKLLLSNCIKQKINNEYILFLITLAVIQLYNTYGKQDQGDI